MPPSCLLSWVRAAACSLYRAVRLTEFPGVNKIYMGFKRFNMRVNYLACTNRRSACLC